MGQPFVGEIRIFGGNFAPLGWEFCGGQLLSIAQNDVLFVLIGTTYGGDGQTTFALPDLRGRVPIHAGTYAGNTYTIGETGGTESVTLTTTQIPAHTHALNCNSGDGISSDPANNFPAAQPSLLPYTANGSANSNLKTNAVSQVGGSQPHSNMIPYLGISYIISLYGIFPSQN